MAKYTFNFDLLGGGVWKCCEASYEMVLHFTNTGPQKWSAILKALEDSAITKANPNKNGNCSKQIENGYNNNNNNKQVDIGIVRSPGEATGRET